MKDTKNTRPRPDLTVDPDEDDAAEKVLEFFLENR